MEGERRRGTALQDLFYRNFLKTEVKAPYSDGRLYANDPTQTKGNTTMLARCAVIG